MKNTASEKLRQRRYM